MNKKIDIIVKYFMPVTAGIETNILNVYGYMVPHGWDITIHTSNSTPDAPHSLQSTDLIRGLKIRRYYWRWYGIVPDIDWAHTPAVALHCFDIFPFCWIMGLVLVRRFLHLPTPVLFLTPHGGYTPGWTTFPFWQRIIKKIYHATLGTFLVNHTINGLRSVSEWESAETIKHGVRKDIIKTITNGLKAEVYTDIDNLASSQIKNIVKNLGKYVVQVGRVHPIKNQATTIKALTDLPADIHFAIAGPVTDPQYKRELDDLIKELKLQNRVHFLGVVEGADIFYLLKHSLANTHMAIWESYCNAVHESMSQGCVCVVSAGTALEELIKDQVNGFCIPPYDHHAVANAIRYILNHRNLSHIQRIKNNNIEFTKGHSWQEISAQVEKFYQDII